MDGIVILAGEKNVEFGRMLGIFVKYGTLIGFLGLRGLSLYRGATTDVGDMERAVWIWKDVLLLNATLGLIGSLLAIDKLSVLTLGKSQNIFDEIMEQDSKEVAVSYNGLFTSSLFLATFGILVILYIKTSIHLFLICYSILAIIFALTTILSLFMLYFQSKQEVKTNLSKLIDPIVLPTIIGLLQMWIINDKTVGFVYENLQTPKHTILLILALIVILCYVPAIAFCHFSNLYCIIAFIFVKKDVRQIQARLDALQGKNAKREDALRQVAGYVDIKAAQGSLFKRIGLAGYLVQSQIKAYFQRNIYEILYLLSFGKLKITELLSGLLESDRIRTNEIRFCEITVVLELLALDMLLFIYLGSDDPCSRFFELLSTVIIIPILLSSLANLKQKKE